MSFDCTVGDCIDGTCRQKCVEYCGGSETNISYFSCGVDGIVCDCIGGVDAGMWIGIVAAVCAVMCAISFCKYWCGRGSSESERKVIVIT